MNTNYYRVTAYHKTENLSVIFDTNGLFDKLWQLSSHLLSKGFEVLEVSSADKFLDGNITKAKPNADSLIVRAYKEGGKPESTTYEFDGKCYYAVKVGDKIYIPDRTRIAGGAV